MFMSQLIPASQCARQFGVKCLAHGGPGSGKTPLTKTAPRPVMLVTEPGMLSMRNAHTIPAWEAYTVARIQEFFDWFLKSHESNNFDTLVVDSVSQMAEIVLGEEMPKHRDPRAAYGAMARQVMEWANAMYYAQQKHIYLVAKQIIAPMNGVATKRYYFPGQDLGVKVPHLYDEILCIGLAQIPNIIQPQRAIQCHASYDVYARDRSGKLAMYEPQDLSALFTKCMT